MKPLLIGMNNPLSDDPDFDLYPYPEGSAGWRLWKMMPEGTSRKQYLELFDRKNLLHAREWDQRAAQYAAQQLLPDLHGRSVVVLGTQVRAALGLPRTEPLLWTSSTIYATHVPGGTTFVPGGITFEWLALPHPSGRNRWFNESKNLAQARLALAGLLGGTS